LATTDDRVTVVQVKHVVAMVWVVMMISLVTLSWTRVYKHILLQNTGENKTGDNNNTTRDVFLSAMTKFLSPLLLTIVALLAIDKNDESSISSKSPSFSLALGLCFCVITIKLIVYSMARMAYASVQFDIVPLMVVLLVSNPWKQMGELKALQILYGALDLFYVVRLGYWIHAAITQLCDRLHIHLFRIPYTNPVVANKKDD
jgi:ethanolaminephosphotransferase